MENETNNWITPEDSLNSFEGIDSSSIDLSESKSSTIQKRYGYKLGSLGLLVPEGALTEVVKKFVVYPVPKTKAWFKGLTNLRGNLVPVYDLGLLLGITDKPVKTDNILVYGKNSEHIGIMINELPKAHDVTGWRQLTDELKIPFVLKEFVIEKYRVDDFVWLSFDHDGLFKAIKSEIPL